MKKENSNRLRYLYLQKLVLIALLLLVTNCSQKKADLVWQQININKQFTLTIPSNLKSKVNIFSYYTQCNLFSDNFIMNFHYGYAVEDYTDSFLENQKTIINNKQAYVKLISKNELEYNYAKLSYLYKHFEPSSSLYKYTKIVYFPNIKNGESLFIVAKCNNKYDLDSADNIIYSAKFSK